MKKNRLKNLLIVLFISIFTFYNCQKQENSQEKGAKIDSISLSLKELDYSKKSIESVDDALKYFKFNGVPANEFIEKNNVDRESFVLLIEENLENFKIKQEEEENSDTKHAIRPKKSCEEIRDVMVNECNNGYCCGLDTACAIAVKIAYHYRKEIQGKC